MPRRDDTISIRQMLDHSREAVEMASGKAPDDIEHERMLELALVRLVEIIGEAASRVTQASQEKYPEIPWREVTGMRNRLAHGYDSIDLRVLWDTIEIDLPPLILQLEKILSK